MEITLTPEQEAQLSQIAMHSGKRAEQLLKDAALRILENNERLDGGVRKGIEAADRGDFVEEEEMHRRIEQMLQY